MYSYAGQMMKLVCSVKRQITEMVAVRSESDFVTVGSPTGIVLFSLLLCVYPSGVLLTSCLDLSHFWASAG